MRQNSLWLGVLLTLVIGTVDFFLCSTVLTYVFAMSLLIAGYACQHKRPYFPCVYGQKKNCALMSRRDLHPKKQSVKDAARASATCGVRSVGRVKFFDVDRKHGFIAVPEYRDVWFAASDVEPGTPLVAGVAVQFELYFGASNRKPRARTVKLMDADLPKHPESQVMFGHVRSVTGGHCFVSCDELMEHVLVGREEFSPRDWGRLQRGQPLRFSLVPWSSKPKAQQVQTVTEKQRGTVRKYFPSDHYGFISFPGETREVWFAAAVVDGGPEEDVPAGLVAGAQVDVEFFSRSDGQQRALHVRFLSGLP